MLRCPYCGSNDIRVRQNVCFSEEYEYNTGDTIWKQHPNEWDFEVYAVFCGSCHADFESLDKLERMQKINFKKFKEMVEMELGTISEEEAKKLYVEFIDSELDFKEWLKVMSS